MAMIVVLAAACGDYNNNGGAGQEQTQNTKNEFISLDKAKELAITNSGADASDVTFAKEELDKDERPSQYELEFYTSKAEYEYEVHAETGDILKSSVQYFPGKSETTQPSEVTITLERAKEIALQDSGLSAADVTFSQTELDQGKNAYEIEFRKDKAEYEYKIDAATGEIRGCSRDL